MGKKELKPTLRGEGDTRYGSNEIGGYEPPIVGS